jgi:hypothetical protein
MCLQQAIEQSRKQHETDLVEKNRLIRMLDDKVLSMYIFCSIDWGKMCSSVFILHRANCNLC